jgi:hypothetical protein
MKSLFAVCCMTICFTLPAVAQSTGPGLVWQGASGANTGSFHPSCTVFPVVASQGESITLRIWGDPNAPFAVGAAFSTIPCTPIPGLGNGLLLGQGLAIIVGGTLTQVTPCLSCPPGYEEYLFTMPTFFPVGTAVSFQALTLGNNSLGLTVAITATVQ